MNEKILVIDDEPDIVDLLASVMQGEISNEKGMIYQEHADHAEAIT